MNDFQYEEIVDLTDYDGWYVMLNIVNEDGMEADIEISSGGACDPNNERRVQCISVVPDYFGDNWLRLLFPYQFSDVRIWENQSIKTVYDTGLMCGTSETSFSPELAMTKGMFVTVLGRMAGIDELDYQTHVFEDVDEVDYYYAYISWAVQNNVVEENFGEFFYPNSPITREQAVLMLTRYAKAYDLNFTKTNHSIPQYNDIKGKSDEFQEACLTLYAADIIRGETNDRFNPDGIITRLETADMIAEMIVKID